jgi:hypothetical protein
MPQSIELQNHFGKTGEVAAHAINRETCRGGLAWFSNWIFNAILSALRGLSLVHTFLGLTIGVIIEVIFDRGDV